MMSDEKVDFKNLVKEISSLKSQLKQINDDKEDWFKKKEDLKKEIAVLIEKVKNLRRETDVSTSEVNKLTKERDKYNSTVKKLIGKITELHKEKNKLLEKHGIKGDPSKIKKDIERLELKIETEVLTMDKEKKLMEYIKRMKKSYEELGGVKLIEVKINDIAKDIDGTKKRANEAHEKLRKVLKEKRSWYREFFSISKKINVIKKQQEKAFETFIGFKNKFLDVSRQLSHKVVLIKRDKKEIVQKKEKVESKKKEQDKKILESRKAKVEEKIKKGEKLTTEDLLAMQGKEDGE